MIVVVLSCAKSEIEENKKVAANYILAKFLVLCELEARRRAKISGSFWSKIQT